MIATKARRGISGKQVGSIGAVLHAITRGLLSFRRSVADYGRRRAGDLSITLGPTPLDVRGRGMNWGTGVEREGTIAAVRPTAW